MDSDQVLERMLALGALAEDGHPLLLGVLMVEGHPGWIVRYPAWEQAGQTYTERMRLLRRGRDFLAELSYRLDCELIELERAAPDVVNVVPDL